MRQQLTITLEGPDLYDPTENTICNNLSRNELKQFFYTRGYDFLNFKVEELPPAGQSKHADFE